jgi:hypothetical protein
MGENFCTEIEAFDPRRSLVEIEIADGFAGVGRFLGLFDRLLEFLFQKISGVLLRFHRLTEDGLATAVLFFHGLGSRLEIVKHLGLDGGGMGDNPFSRWIDLQHRAAAGAGYIESRGVLCHTGNHSANARFLT